MQRRYKSALGIKFAQPGLRRAFHKSLSRLCLTWTGLISAELKEAKETLACSISKR
jgi:hypothetical protein